MKLTLALVGMFGALLIGCANNSSQVSGNETTTSVSAHAAGPASLEGTKWRLEDLGGAGVVPKVEATIEFMDSGRVAGKGSCNRFFGTATISGESIHFGPIGSTKMACLDTVVSRQETNYFTALEGAEKYTRQDSTLLIYYKGSDKPLRFAQRTE